MPSGPPKRILIVDDSAVMRSLLRSVIMRDSTLRVAGTADDGRAALECINSVQPDLILLDVEMPVMDGLATLRELRRRSHRMPVIVCSGLTQRGARITLDALACGASDYVAKPAGQSNREEAAKVLALDLLPKIEALTRNQALAQMGPRSGPRPGPLAGPPSFPLAAATALAVPKHHELRAQRSSQPTVLAIGVSTGGPAALDILLPALPAGFPLPVLVVQHMPELFTSIFAERLDGRCRLRVRQAETGDVLRPGSIFIARGNWHMEVRPSTAATHILRLNQEAPENHCRPAVDVLFRSVAAAYGAGVLAVVLTGMGCDGMFGCRVIREHGGLVLAQDEASSTVWGMPGAVVQAGLAHKVLPLQDIAAEIVRLTNGLPQEAQTLREMAG